MKDRLGTNLSPKMEFIEEHHNNISIQQLSVPGGATTLLGVKVEASGQFEWTIDLDAAEIPAEFTIANVSEYAVI